MPTGVYIRGLTIQERFWSHIDKTIGRVRPKLGKCWIWTGSTYKYGYGAFNKMGAHRYSYELHIGKVPDGLWVLHRCDTPLCVRPEHLFVGTVQDNVDDMWDKGRAYVSKGEEIYQAKLTAEAVAYIRKHYVKGRRGKPGNGYELAAKFGININTLYDVVKNRSWRHVQ